MMKKKIRCMFKEPAIVCVFGVSFYFYINIHFKLSGRSL
jgi:hypothetical protein